jgi:ATP-binding cassette subfamily B (MDR/TAP) protein 1
MESVRTLIAISVQNRLQLHEVGIITAFLNGKLEEEVYMIQPEGFVSAGKRASGFRLKKLYMDSSSPHVVGTPPLIVI